MTIWHIFAKDSTGKSSYLRTPCWNERTNVSVIRKIIMSSTMDKGSAVLDALAQGQVDRVNVLLKEGAPLDLKRSAEIVVENGQCEALKFLVNKCDLDVNTNFLLHRALFAKQESVAKLLVKLGADVDECEEEPKNSVIEDFPQPRDTVDQCFFDLPLQLSLHCSVDMMCFLFHQATDSLDKTLLSACHNSVDVDRVAFLLENKADIYAKNESGQSPLHLAIKAGNTAKVKLLIDHGADIEDRNYDGQTPVMCACDSSVSTECLQLLLEKGANPNSKDTDKKGALHFAVEGGDIEKINLLVQQGAHLENRTSNCDTPLTQACKTSVSVDCLRTLLELGAFPNAKNNTRATALALARKSNDEEKINLLVEYGATEVSSHSEETALMTACKITSGVMCVSYLLENNASLSLQNDRGETAVHYAAKSADVEKMELLLKYKADLNAVNHIDETALMELCNKHYPSKYYDCVKFLLENGALPNLTNLTGQTALHKAAETGDVELVRILVQHNAHVNAMNHYDETPLMKACGTKSDVECVKFLLENGALPNLVNERRETALHYAAQTGDLEKMKILVVNKANVDEMNDDTETPLMKACAQVSVNVECVRFLLENKASPTVTNIKGRTAFHNAADVGDIEKMQLLMQYKLTVNTMADSGETPLMLACANKSVKVECVKFLLENSALPDLSNQKGETALHCAAGVGDVEKMRMLIENKADVNVMNKYGKTPLINACAGNSVTVTCVQFLLENDAWPNLTHKGNETALHLAVQAESVVKAKLLIKHGADIESRNHKGETPYLTAARIVNHQLIEHFQELGADITAVDSSKRNAVMLIVRKGCKKGKNVHDSLQCLIDKGVPVNQKDEKGRTPLMFAARCENLKVLKLLLEANADVHVVNIEKTDTGVQENTALSILLENAVWNRNACLEELIKYGAAESVPKRCNGCLHEMIKYDEREMIHLMLMNGWAPTMSNAAFQYPFRNPWVTCPDTASPLTVALQTGNVAVVRYLLGNLMLCSSDISGHLYHSLWRHELVFRNKFDIVKLMDEFYSHPKSLFQLSFVAVSYTLGGVPGRLARINHLPLPSILKDMLLFRDTNVPLDLLHVHVDDYADSMDLDMDDDTDSVNYNTDSDSDHDYNLGISESDTDSLDEYNIMS